MVKLGIVGLSPGNGHPYSWAAIFNGYNKSKIAESGFPVISNYLEKENFPSCLIPDAEVTHIYTDNFNQSKHIAESCLIKNISKSLEQLIDSVDAVLLARDDAENHFDMSSLALERGLPIFIDKPLAYNRKEAQRIFEKEQYDGQIFSCSGLRFSKLFINKKEIFDEVGEIERIEAESPKDWQKYAVHLIDPVVSHFLNLSMPIYIKSINKKHEETNLIVESEGKQFSFVTTGNSEGDISFRFIGKRNEKVFIWDDTFYSFKETLKAFLNGVKLNKRIIPKEETLKICELIGYAEKKY